MKRHAVTRWRSSIGSLVGSMVILLAAASVAQAEKPVRLFILSGQSNMVHVKPDESFRPLVEKAFPEDEIIIVHFASSGQLIRKWHKAWQLPPNATLRGQGPNGRLYNRLIDDVGQAMQDRPRPSSVTFVWMQGEADANDKLYGEIYGESLVGLLDQLREDLGREDIDFVLGRISDFGLSPKNERPGWPDVRRAQEEFADADARRSWVDTDDLNGKSDGLHYNKDGYEKLGQRFAEAAVRLLKGEDEKANPGKGAKSP